MPGETVLVVDDERKIVEIVRAYLEKEGMRVVTAADGRAALQQFRRERPGIIVLDVMLPDLSGWDVCRTIRQESAVPIILLTARDDVTDKVLGLELGADDYVTKPFDARELVARVRAHLRRAVSNGRPEPAARIVWGDVSINPDQREVLRAGRVVALTRSEFDLLYVLAAHPGRVYTRLQLLEATQGDAFEGYERAIDSHVQHLRQKLEPAAHTPQYVLTVYGVGYKGATFVPAESGSGTALLAHESRMSPPVSSASPVSSMPATSSVVSRLSGPSASLSPPAARSVTPGSLPGRPASVAKP